MRTILATLLLAALVTQASAQETTVDISNVTNYLIEVLAAVLIVVATWAVKKFGNKLNVDIDIEKGSILANALQRGIDYAENELKKMSGRFNKIEVENELVRTAAKYAISKVPDTVNHFQLGPEQIQEMVRARLTPRVVERVMSEPAPGSTT